MAVKSRTGLEEQRKPSPLKDLKEDWIKRTCTLLCLFICEYSYTNINTLQSLPVLMTPSALHESKLYRNIVLSGRRCRFLTTRSTWNTSSRVTTHRKSSCKGNHLTNIHNFITTQALFGVLVLIGCSLNIGSNVTIPLGKKFYGSYVRENMKKKCYWSRIKSKINVFLPCFYISLLKAQCTTVKCTRLLKLKPKHLHTLSQDLIIG